MLTLLAPPVSASAGAENLTLIANGHRILAEIRRSDREIQTLIAQSRRQLAESYRLLRTR